mgnify:CR=1 FL=1
MDLAKTMEELDKKKEALSAEKTQAVERMKQMEAAANEKLEPTKQQNEEPEWAKHVLKKLQTTYQKKAVEYESQAQAETGKERGPCTCSIWCGTNPEHRISMGGTNPGKHE